VLLSPWGDLSRTGSTGYVRLGGKFFDRNTVTVARELLGKYVVRRVGRKKVAGMITETEAYHGPRDRASHASRGLTERTKVMFGPPGHAYIYLIYGMYQCLNFVTMRRGYPAAVLIRALDLPGADGPGRLCRALHINRKLNGVGPGNTELWVEDPAPELRSVRGCAVISRRNVEVFPNPAKPKKFLVRGLRSDLSFGRVLREMEVTFPCRNKQRYPLPMHKPHRRCPHQ
jgi:DNA-3-methyladenine glycosylase